MIKLNFTFMRKLLLLFSLLTGVMFGSRATELSADTIRVYDSVVFYDGYRMADNPDSLLKDGVLRHSCSLYSTKLSDDQLDEIGKQLKMNITIEALCDNYDRIGNVNIAFVEKGMGVYDPWQTDRIEIGRFITPFMNKNKKPTSVPYNYDITYLSSLLRDKDLRSNYDIWLEFEVFGVPYAANEQIAGCSGRSDVFAGTLELVTTTPDGPTEGNVLIPIVIKKPEYMGGNLNNYKEEATDELGTTRKTYTFNVKEDVSDGQLVLITSNHGANAGGEEYARRWHFVYVDDELVLSYKPGRDSCEPFRKYNTQPNGIYGTKKRSDGAWQSFSNWCPGDVIDNRIISLGEYKEGEHKVTIAVPDALFFEKQGDIPVSLYFQGVKNGKLDLSGIEDVNVEPDKDALKFNGSTVDIASDKEVRCVEVFSLDAELLYRQWNGRSFSLENYRPGVYVIGVEFVDGSVLSKKIKI